MQIQVTAILLQMLNFGIVLGALTYLLLKPIKKVLDERAARVAEGQKAAEEAVKEKASIEELKEKVLKEARAKAKDMLAEARKEVDAKRDEWMEEAKADAAKARAKAEKTLASERAAMVESMQDDFNEAVFLVAEKVLGEEISQKQHASLVKQGLKEIASAE